MERFHPEQAARVISELEELELPLLEGSDAERYRIRVHLGILKFADGDMGRFALAVRQARMDWRDLLVMAGLESKEWAQVLVAAGYRVPPDP